MDYRTSRQFRLDKDLYASQGTRLANYLIDYVCQILLMFALVVVLTMISVIIGNDSILARIENMNQIEEYGAAVVIILIYYNVFEIFFSRTIGKFITKTIVVNINGEKPDSQEILVRSLCRLIPFDGFSFLGAPNKGWHDSISKTYVVKKELLEKKKELFYSLDEIGNNTNEL
ncbi:RDD family protein [Flavobacterium microcysteis]|uniref:RDD family protein n=1 Tax=Flavobacterium microcysteis TaxID=2596891 RepID=A0A501Q083_9FLAO|nr:RDD family protein [Flavobacterium microcysteis]TPD65416.1 RDD family protein [Flavobacterium microcysteis]